MITAEATAPERIKLGFSGPEWEMLRDRVDFGQQAALELRSRREG